jgi:hypothetical protein
LLLAGVVAAAAPLVMALVLAVVLAVCLQAFQALLLDHLSL